jgi:F0F1-type ATP synthase epsilon subunit
MMELSLDVNIRSRRKSYFEGKTYSVSSLNDTGEFDVLPQHANFISLIRNQLILNKSAKDEQKFVISTGIMRVKDNKVDVFLDV